MTGALSLLQPRIAGILEIKNTGLASGEEGRI
jgi:hypothetical protein